MHVVDQQPDDELDESLDELADDELPDDALPADEVPDDELLLDELLPDDELADDEVLAPVSDPVTTARRRHGAAGAILAAGMFGLDKALGRKVKEEAPIVIAAGTQPVDIDSDGIEIPIDDETSVFAPAQPPSDPFPPRRRRR